MKLRITPRALREAKRTKTWWHANRPAAPDLFETEFARAVERIVTSPDLGTSYPAGDPEIAVRRILLPKSEYHVYYATAATEVVVLSVWGAQRKRGPKL